MRRKNDKQHFKKCLGCLNRFYLHRTNKLNIDCLNKLNLCYECVNKKYPTQLNIHIGLK